ncbi:MAG: deoxynucleoside kinase [Gammaproteobacteria bacterium]
MPKKWPDHFRYVVIEGPIGVGKTTLARALAEYGGAELLLEQPMDNPFLERFYIDPKGAALPTQLHFLFQRARQCQEMRQSDMFEPLRVADFMLDKDRLFAQLNLDDDELTLYEMVYEKLAIDSPQPDLVIYLQADVPTLMARIRKRGIDYEQRITEDYLRRLCDAYTRFFHHFSIAPLLIVNTNNASLVDDDAQFEQFLSQIQALRSGRRFYNPSGDLPL